MQWDQGAAEAKLDEAFRSSLGLSDSVELGTAAYGRLDEWDSVAHMKLVAAIEDAFGIMLDTEDVVDMSDYPTVQRILRERYGVALAA